MPELPEVETIRRDLEPLVVGRTITAVAIAGGAERLAVTHSPRALERQLTGRRIEALGRPGKYMLASLDDQRTWVLPRRIPGCVVPTPPAGLLKFPVSVSRDPTGIAFVLHFHALPDQPSVGARSRLNEILAGNCRMPPLQSDQSAENIRVHRKYSSTTNE